MMKVYFRARHLLVSLLKQRFQIRWKKAMSMIVIVGAMVGGVSGTAQAMTTTTGQGFYGDASLAAPRLVQPELGVVGSAYLSTHIEKNRSSVPQSMPLGMVGAAVTATRCPAFVSWEDWGGARVHAYVDFRPSDLCNGRHVKVAYVRLIRQCGPYFDTGRIYTNTASTQSDTRLYSVSVWILDSPLWWCNTNTYYGYVYF
jgi:hypothetical protein